MKSRSWWWTGSPGVLQFMGLQRVGHDWTELFLAIVNRAAMNTRVHVFFWIRVFSRYMPRSGIAASYDYFIFSFLKISILFFVVAAPIYIPMNSVWFPFSIPSQALAICKLLITEMGKQWKQWETFSCGARKSLQMVTAAKKLKDTCSLEEKLWPT